MSRLEDSRNLSSAAFDRLLRMVPVVPTNPDHPNHPNQLHPRHLIADIDINLRRVVAVPRRRWTENDGLPFRSIAEEWQCLSCMVASDSSIRSYKCWPFTMAQNADKVLCPATSAFCRWSNSGRIMSAGLKTGFDCMFSDRFRLHKRLGQWVRSGCQVLWGEGVLECSTGYFH